MVLNHHHRPCLKNIVPKQKKYCDVHVVCRDCMLPSVDNSWKLLGFVDCHILIVKVLLVVVNMQFGMQVIIPAQWQWVCFNIPAQWQS